MENSSGNPAGIHWEVYQELKQKALAMSPDLTGWGVTTVVPVLDHRVPGIQTRCGCAGDYQRCKYGMKSTYFQRCRFWTFERFCDVVPGENDQVE